MAMPVALRTPTAHSLNIVVDRLEVLLTRVRLIRKAHVEQLPARTGGRLPSADCNRTWISPLLLPLSVCAIILVPRRAESRWGATFTPRLLMAATAACCTPSPRRDGMHCSMSLNRGGAHGAATDADHLRILISPDGGWQRWHIVETIANAIHVNLAEGRLVRALGPQSLEVRTGGSVAGGLLHARRARRHYDRDTDRPPNIATGCRDHLGNSRDTRGSRLDMASPCGRIRGCARRRGLEAREANVDNCGSSQRVAAV